MRNAEAANFGNKFISKRQKEWKTNVFSGARQTRIQHTHTHKQLECSSNAPYCGCARTCLCWFSLAIWPIHCDCTEKEIDHYFFFIYVFVFYSIERKLIDFDTEHSNRKTWNNRPADKKKIAHISIEKGKNEFYEYVLMKSKRYIML